MYWLDVETASRIIDHHWDQRGQNIKKKQKRRSTELGGVFLKPLLIGQINNFISVYRITIEISIRTLEDGESTYYFFAFYFLIFFFFFGLSINNSHGRQTGSLILYLYILNGFLGV